MFSKTEKEIMKFWENKETDMPIVTIRCMTYNHEKYISKAIESFLSQVTNFPFEIVIHDDASTDKTADIIREYEKKYPTILKPIYEKDNLWSKHDGSINKIMDKYIHGRFVAFCEGDDYWCDEGKLQKQYDYMVKHEECVLCCHNTIVHDINEIENNQKFNEWTKIHPLTDEEIFFGWNVHTSSYFLRRELLYAIDIFNTRFGDYVILTVSRYKGVIVALPDVMSVYNSHVPAGATARYYSTDNAVRIETIKSRKNYLMEYNEFTGGQFKYIVDLRIAELTLQSSDDKAELFEASYILRKSKVYRNIIKKQKILTRIKSLYKVYGSILGNIWYRSIIAFQIKRL